MWVDPAHNIRMENAPQSRMYKVGDPDDMRALSRIITNKSRLMAFSMTIGEELASDTNLYLANRLRRDPDYCLSSPQLSRIMTSLLQSSIDLHRRGKVGIAMDVSGTRKTAAKELGERCAEKRREQHGHDLTRSQIQAIAQDVIDQWPDKAHKPPRDFWLSPVFFDETEIQNVPVYDEHPVDFEGIYREMDATASNREAQRRGKELVWAAMAPTCPIRPVTEADERMFKSMTDTDWVVRVATAWMNRHPHKWTYLLFAPFGHTSIEQKDEIVRILLITPALAGDLLTHAYTTARQRKATMSISPTTAQRGESLRNPRNGQFGQDPSSRQDTQVQLAGPEYFNLDNPADFEQLSRIVRAEAYAVSRRRKPMGAGAAYTNDLYDELTSRAGITVVTIHRKAGKVSGWEARHAVKNAMSTVRNLEQSTGSMYGGEMNSAEGQARKKYIELKRKTEEELGRQLTPRERRDAEAQVIAQWPQYTKSGKRRKDRPAAGFAEGNITYAAARVDADGQRQSLDEMIGMANPAVDVFAEIDSGYADLDIDDLSKHEATRAWFAGETGGNYIVAETYSQRKASTYRKIVEGTGKSVVALCDEWESAEDDADVSDALFAPFQNAVSDRERENVVHALRSQSKHADRLWVEALRASTKHPSRAK